MLNWVAYAMAFSTDPEFHWTDVRLTEQRQHKIPAPHVVRRIAEKGIAEWVVTHVLNNAAAISIGTGLAELLRGRAGKACEQQIS